MQPMRATCLREACTIVIGAMALAGCGGNAEGDDRAQIEALIDEYASASSAESYCGTLTAELQSQLANLVGASSCVEAVDQPGVTTEPAEDYTVENLTIEGRSARATVDISNSPSSSTITGSQQALRFTKTDSGWRISDLG